MRFPGFPIVLAILCALPGQLPAMAEGDAEARAEAICTEIATAAERAGLSPAFLARVLWHQTGFAAPEAVSPTAVTLGELQARHGNPGLAALALSGGADQIETFLRGEGIPPETVDFVLLTTGITPDTWRDRPPAQPRFTLSALAPFARACPELALGSWGAPLPDVTAWVPPVRAIPDPPDPAARSLRPRLRPIPKLAKWGAQLAFGDTRERARANFTRATRGCRKAVGETADIVFVENRVRGRPGYWMARVSRMDRDAAEDICRAARAQGCSCVVYKNY